MQISAITAEFVAEYLRLEEDEYSSEYLQSCIDASISFICNYTGLPIADVMQKDEFTTVALILCQDMYDNRSLYIEKSNVNKVVDAILSMYCVNMI